jgi:hypothetical protein
MLAYGDREAWAKEVVEKFGRSPCGRASGVSTRSTVALLLKILDDLREIEWQLEDVGRGLRVPGRRRPTASEERRRAVTCESAEARRAREAEIAFLLGEFADDNEGSEGFRTSKVPDERVVFSQRGVGRNGIAPDRAGFEIRACGTAYLAGTLP